jgi:cytochrome d ubiquinol oxidase subunit II
VTLDLHIVWFILLGALMAGYAVLDGFDFGVGILHLLARSDDDRRLFINAIGPIWDGNEVWLVTFGGALFAAFPLAYATIFSGLYVPFMMLLFALIFRAVSIEFRGKKASALWRSAWDLAFFGSSLLASFLFGVAVGNGMAGIQLNDRAAFTGTVLSLLNPYALMAGLVVVSMFAMHASIYLFLKLPAGPLRDRVRQWMWHTWGLFLVLYILGSIFTVGMIPRATANFAHHPWAAAVVVLNVLAVANIPRSVFAGRPVQAFISSSMTIVALVFLFGMALWPNLVTASNDAANSLTIYNAASSPNTLRVMFIIALIGMPFVLAYTITVYWTFRGKVSLGKHSY